jgi:hypothetical protein
VADTLSIDAETNSSRSARRSELEQAMRDAVAEALDEHRKAGHTIVVFRDEKVVWLKPGEC